MIRFKNARFVTIYGIPLPKVLVKLALATKFYVSADEMLKIPINISKFDNGLGRFKGAIEMWNLIERLVY